MTYGCDWFITRAHRSIPTSGLHRYMVYRVEAWDREGKKNKGFSRKCVILSCYYNLEVIHSNITDWMRLRGERFQPGAT